MNKIKERWSKFSKSQKILAILIGICIIAVIAASCSGPSSNESSDDQSNIKQEEQIEEPAVEDKSEPIENPEPEPELGDVEDEYASPNEVASSKSYSLETVDTLALSLFREYFESDSYNVTLKTTNSVVSINIIGYELDTSSLSKDQIEYGLYKANIPSTFDNLAYNVEEFYNKAGYDVSVKIKLYDTNGVLLYTARS